LIISLNPDFKDIKLDRTKVNYYNSFFKLEKSFDFNTLAFFLDRKEKDNDYSSDGKIKLTNFEVFNEGKFFCEFVKNLLDKEARKINAFIFASMSKIALSENHFDGESVFLFPVLGSVVYNVYNETTFTPFYLNVGDLLIIPKNVVHSAIPICSRIVVSVGVYD
jgi:hypothetical protein